MTGASAAEAASSTAGSWPWFEPFPHVGGVATRADKGRVGRLLEELTGMLHERERIFAQLSIDSMEQLRTLHRAGRVALPRADVVLMVDGYGAMRGDFDEFDGPFTDILLRASSFGIHIVLGLTRWGELRMAHQPLIGTKIELRLNDPSDSTIDRKLSTTMSADTPGRALTDGSLFGQVALPLLDADVTDVGEALEELALRSARSWSGPSAAPIRLLPADLDPGDLPDEFAEPDAVPVGLRQDSMETAIWDFLGEDQHLMVFGDSKCGKTSLLRLLADQLVARFESDELVIAVMDVRGRIGSVVPEEYLGAYARTPVQARNLSASIARELEQRAGRDADGQAGSARIVVLVDDYDIVSAGGSDPLGPLLPHLPSARDLKLHVVLVRPVAGAARALYERALQVVRDTGAATLVMSGERSEGALLPRVFAERMPAGRGRWVRRGERPHLVQLAHRPPSSP